MILLGSTLINAPVMGLNTGSELARIHQPIIDPANLCILAYELKGDLLPKSTTLLRIADVRELSDMGFIVDSSDEFIEPSDVIKLEAVYKLQFKLLGMRVTDQQRRRLGKVIDYTLETTTFSIQQLTVRRPLLKSLNDTELLIHRSQIVEINDNSIVVHSAAIAPEPELHEVPGSYINPFRNTKSATEASTIDQR
ncbi:MAG: hypothetical protein WAQ25_04960 [Candidatus Saccharimonas sp.]